MYRLLPSGSSVSIIWVIRSIPSVVTFRACVSPRLNRLEPCARGINPTSAESGRMSLGPRPAGRAPRVGPPAPGLEQVRLQEVLDLGHPGLALRTVGHDRGLEALLERLGSRPRVRAVQRVWVQTAGVVGGGGGGT